MPERCGEDHQLSVCAVKSVLNEGCGFHESSGLLQAACRAEGS